MAIAFRTRRALPALALAAILAACATTQQVAISDTNYCPFLGAKLCSQLSANNLSGRFSSGALFGGSQVHAGMSYRNPRADWAKYNKVLIAPVTFWGGDDTTVSPADQQRLTDFATQALDQQLATQYSLVREPGSGVMTVQVAIIDAESATPVLRTISMLIPQARALSTLKYLATGTYAFVGSAEAEIKIMDSVTHEILGAGVDKRVGGGSISTAAQWQWGDAENVMTAWAKAVSVRLAELRSGQP